MRPDLSLTSCQLISTAITAGVSRVAAGQLCLLAVAITPAGLMVLVRSYCPISGGPPDYTAGWLLRYSFRGLLSVYSRYALHARQVASATLYTGGSDGFVSSTAAPIASGWSEPSSRAGLSPAVDQRLFTAHA